MSYNTKNYLEQGGEVLHIGGRIVFDGDDNYPIENIPASTATTASAAVTDLNMLLAALKASGLMAPDAT